MDDDYLKKDFDIGKLTIPKIKKILIENGITEFPTRVKKDQLIEIFNKNIDLIRKKKREEKKKEESRSKNIYQEGRSSIIELEVNKKDGEGGEYTSGRPKGKDDERKDIKGKIEDIKGTKQFINTASTSNPSPQNHSPPPIHNSSFLDSLTAHLKSTSKRRKSLEDVNKDKEKEKERDREDKSKKVIVEVDSGVSDTTFLKIENNEGINKGSKVVVSSKSLTTKSLIPNPHPINPYLPKYLYILLLPLFLIPFYFLLPYCTNGDFICLPVPLNGKIVNKKLVCDKGFVLKKSFFREKCIKDSKEIRMLKRINLIINELEILKGDYKLGLVKDYKRNVWDVLEGDYDKGDYDKGDEGKGDKGKDYKDEGKDYKDKGQGDTTKHKNHNIELLQILKHSHKVKIHNDLIYSIKYKITLKSFIRHLKSFIRNYSLKAFYFLLLILFLILIFYIFYKRRQGLLEKKNQSQKIVKEILNILLRQLIISSKNTRFPGFVYVDHLKDVFLLEKKLWEMVKENVEKNSNVKKGKNEEKETWEWVGPYVENPIM